MDISDLREVDETCNLDWEKALSQFQNVMVSGTMGMQIKAMIMLAHQSKHAPESVLSRIIPHLTGILGDYQSNQSSGFSLQKASAYCLKCIASRGDGELAMEIGRHGAATSLLRWLSHSDGEFQEVLIKCLLVVVTFSNRSRAAVASSGGLEIIISLLDLCTDDDIRLYLLEILSALALLKDVRRALARFGGLHLLVEAASSGTMVSRERACQAIGLLGVPRRSRRMLIEIGVIPVLVELLSEGDETTKLVAGNALGVISAHVDYIRPVAQAGVISLYAELLQGLERTGKDIAEDVFCILAVAEENAIEIVGHLVRILREGDEESKASAAEVMWDLSGYKHSASVIQESGAIPILIELLRSETEEVRQNVSGACAQLSYEEADRMALAEAGAIPILIDMMLHDELEDVRDNAAEALINFAGDPLYNNRVSDAISFPSFREIQNRITFIRASNEHMARSMRRMSDWQLTWNPDHV
ncbi:vacuolar protein 8 [Senna tora]|uniref:Vacuolar protein 8 n=1 Tax=Senna tora TaxID=362788 RepID=A0A834WRC1_9FABA|nr:vacuolar protein 8 [Senna tora]